MSTTNDQREPVDVAFPALAELPMWDLIRVAGWVDEHGTSEATRRLAEEHALNLGMRFRDVERWIRVVASAWSPVSASTLAERAEQSGWAWNPDTREWKLRGQTVRSRPDEHRGEVHRWAYARSTRCGECGGWVEMNMLGREEMVAAGECFDCHYWLGFVRCVDEPNVVRVERVGGGDVVHYTVGPVVSYRDGAGHGGRRFDVGFNDGRQVTTRNLWYQGAVPDRFRALLPVNARFVTADDAT